MFAGELWAAIAAIPTAGYAWQLSGHRYALSIGNVLSLLLSWPAEPTTTHAIGHLSGAHFGSRSKSNVPATALSWSWPATECLSYGILTDAAATAANAGLS